MEPANEESSLLRHRHGSDSRQNIDNGRVPPGASAHRMSFLMGLLGVLVGAALVSLAPLYGGTNHSPTTAAMSVPLLGSKHHASHHSQHHSAHHDDSETTEKSVVDKGNWIEAFSVSQAVLVPSSSSTTTLHASGQTAFNGTDLVGADMASQFAAAIANVDATLALADMTKCDIVKIQVFVNDVNAALEAWEVYNIWMAPCAVKPANTLVEISSLFRPDALIEIDVTSSK